MKPFPKPLPFRSLIGPSFIILGVGLGSGELILWPYLASNFGLGIIWAAVLGITFQFIINMEIERYTLATGESVFVGLTKKFGPWAPIWFILSTFIPWMWPGIIASAAKLGAAAIGVPYNALIPILFLFTIGFLFSLGKVVYKTQEQIQKTIILLGVPFVFFITLMLARTNDFQALAQGLVGNGDGYWFLPEGLPFATFLTALAYAGAGGNLNLAQSLYIREKGYGMAFYSDKLTNIFFGKKQSINLNGHTFEPTKENLNAFSIWWRRINLEHALIFWITGAFTMLMLSLLAYSTVYGNPNTTTSINFVIEEARVIGQQTVPSLGTLFLAMAALMLFGTQFSVYGSNSRIMSENLILAQPKSGKTENLSKYFYGFLWFQLLAGSLIFLLGFREPLALLVIGGALNAISMFIYTGLMLWLNTTELLPQIRPSKARIVLVFAAFSFYGVFSIFTIANAIFK